MPDATPLQQSDQYLHTVLYLGADAERVQERLLIRRNIFGLSCTIAHRCPIPELEHIQTSVLLHNPAHEHEISQHAFRIFPQTHHAIWDISNDLETSWKLLRGNWRTALRKAEKSDLITIFAPFSCKDQWILEQDQKRQKERGYRGWPPYFIMAYAQKNPKDCIVFRALKNDQTIAAIIVLKHGSGATYAIAANTETGQRSNAHAFLIWQSSLWLRGQGVTQFDLGRLDWHNSEGLAKFKLGTGAQIVTFPGTYVCLLKLQKRKKATLRAASFKSVSKFLTR